GDFRLGNCIISAAGDVQAVLDWEICTLGDPLADVGYVVATWPERELERSVAPDNPVTAPGFPPRATLLERYANRTGRDLSLVPFYVAFSYYRLACILHGVLARAVGGAQGGANEDEIEQFRERIDGSAQLAFEQASAL